MSSTLDMSSILSTISSLETQLATLRAQLGGAPSGAKSSSVKTPAEKKPRKKSDAPPTAWRLFTDRVRDLLRSNGYEGKAIGVECVQFCSTLKDELEDGQELSFWADADILARRGAWSAPEVSKQKAAGKSWRKAKTGSSTASVVSDGGSVKSGPAPVLAEVEAPSATDGGASVSSDKKKPGPSKGKKWSAEAKASAAAKRAAKKASKTTEDAPASAVALPLLPPSPEDSGDEDELAGFQRVSLAGARYWVNMKDGRAYHRESDDSRGDWAGLFVRDPKPRIDDSVADPNAELTFTDLEALD
jgi:hypothetical protein